MVLWFASFTHCYTVCQYMNMPPSVQSSVYRQLRFPFVLDISNNAALCHYCEYIWCLYTHLSVGCLVRSEIARLQCMCMFNFSIKCQAVFQCGWTSSYPHLLCMRVPVAPRRHQHLIWKVFSAVTILGGCALYFILVLICIFLITNEVERLLIYLLVIWLSCYFFSSCFWIGYKTFESYMC